LVAQAQQQHQQQHQQQQQHNNHHHAHQPIESKIEIVEYKNESCSSPNYCHMEASLSHRLGASSSASTPNAMATGILQQINICFFLSYYIFDYKYLL